GCDTSVFLKPREVMRSSKTTLPNESATLASAIRLNQAAFFWCQDCQFSLKLIRFFGNKASVEATSSLLGNKPLTTPELTVSLVIFVYSLMQLKGVDLSAISWRGKSLGLQPWRIGQTNNNSIHRSKWKMAESDQTSTCGAMQPEPSVFLILIEELIEKANGFDAMRVEEDGKRFASGIADHKISCFREFENNMVLAEMVAMVDSGTDCNGAQFCSAIVQRVDLPDQPLGEVDGGLLPVTIQLAPTEQRPKCAHKFQWLKISDHEVVTDYVRMAQHGLPSCRLAGNHYADMVSRIEVLSLVTKPTEDAISAQLKHNSELLDEKDAGPSGVTKGETERH
ncbi:hypothetical protein Tco_0731098, partial [Tanacetum coccineum]